jgi:hypothetical protein
MRIVLACVLLSAGLSAQNFVTNGDFSAGISGWTENGFSNMPGIETFDTTGLGASQCYGCGPGGQVTPPPYAPNSIDQTVTMVPGIPWEISADLTTTQLNAAAANVDAGTVYVEVGGVEVARTVLTRGNIGPLMTWRGRLCARFTSTSAGPTPLSIKFIRAYLCNATTPRIRIDNISLQIALGPTFCIQAPQRIGMTSNLTVTGPASATYAVFIAANRLANGIQIPGVNGLWFLDPASTATLMGGTLDANGKAATTISIPNDLNLTVGATHFQSAQILGGAISLGFAFAAVFTT